jgi:hypothetical protein
LFTKILDFRNSKTRFWQIESYKNFGFKCFLRHENKFQTQNIKENKSYSKSGMIKRGSSAL